MKCGAADSVDPDPNVNDMAKLSGFFEEYGSPGPLARPLAWPFVLTVRWLVRMHLNEIQVQPTCIFMLVVSRNHWIELTNVFPCFCLDSEADRGPDIREHGREAVRTESWYLCKTACSPHAKCHKLRGGTVVTGARKLHFGARHQLLAKQCGKLVESAMAIIKTGRPICNETFQFLICQ